jgi:hypothetical protein
MSERGAPYWEATRDGRFELPWCRACGRPHWYPREVCPHCLSDAVEWRAATGRGVVYAASTMPRPALPMLADRVPYVVALVELDEGVRMMTNIVDVDPDAVTVGLAVELRWEELSDGRRLAVFAPATGVAGG